MIHKTLKPFPKDFLWGASTSAYQVEGANLEDGKVHDAYRIEYLRKHIEQIRLAISDGCEMLGYNPWSAIDLISTHEGMKKRYGFIYVDRDEFDLKTLDRYRKDSFYWYKKVIASNGEDLSD